MAWLQTYVDMVKAGTVDKAQLVTADDRTALELFTSGNAPFYNTGPQLIREVKTSNPDLYSKLAIAPFPVGKSGVIQPTSMAISVKADTEFPKAAQALAVFFTNPTSEVEFSKIVAVYPSTLAAYDDPFFSEEPELIEDSARPLAEGHHLQAEEHHAVDPEEGRRQRDRRQGGRVRDLQQCPSTAGPD